jgi:hypothetical protein
MLSALKPEGCRTELNGLVLVEKDVKEMGVRNWRRE